METFLDGLKSDMRHLLEAKMQDTMHACEEAECRGGIQLLPN
jgi:hypothetical protein